MKKVKYNMIRGQQFKIVRILCICMILVTGSCKKDKPTVDTESVKDIDGNVYTTVKVGNRIWMVENLRTTKYNDGTPIQNVSVEAAWITVSTNGAWCYYNNETVHNNSYGKLYNWYAVNTGKLCPKGWHIPTDAEWTQLADELGGVESAGGKMKATGNIEAETGQWKAPNTGATNESGFTGLPGGFRYYNGAFQGIGNFGHWWSSTEYDEGIAWFVQLDYGDSHIDIDGFNKIGGFSCRCVRD